jgi:type I restriction enzyme M protein
MFLYGDGDAIIVNGDGLDDFKASKTFQGLLKSTDEYSQLEKFDVVVSNPPFSISGFKADVASVDQNFELAAHVGLSSSEIECLFIERAAQLLRPGGYMGLILPLSILNNQHAVYREARKLLLIQFEVCGLVELRDKTFKPTNTTTVGVFGRKRSQQELLTATLRICEAVLARDSKDAAAAEAVQFAISLGVSLDALEEQAAVMLPQITDSEPVWIEGCGIPDELCLALHSLLNNRSVALVFTGDKKEQEAFLGYRYSKARGRETLDILRTEDGSLLSSLYDEKFLLNTEKANSHILAAFNGVPEAVPPQLAGSVTYAMLRDLVKHDGLLIDNPSQF